jgi:type VI secretion system ImpH/TssG family protein
MENIRRLVKTLSNNLSQKVSAPDFWELVRKLENSNIEKPRLGHAKSPADENVRFGQMPYLYLPASDVAQIMEGKRAGIEANIFTYFMGLLGINGPMPLEFTSYVYNRSFSYFDNTWRRFLDIIHHRMHVLYYRAFALNEQSISYDRPANDPIRDIIKSLTGLPPEIYFGSKNEMIALSNACDFSFAAKNSERLENALRRILKVDVKVNEFVAASYDMDPDDYAQLGSKKTAVLGVNLQIGRTYISATRRFEIEIGPIGAGTYQVLVINTDALSILTQTIHLFLDRPLDYTALIHIERGVVLQARLGFNDAGYGMAHLGYQCWIGNTDREMELRIDVSRFNRMKTEINDFRRKSNFTHK